MNRCFAIVLLLLASLTLCVKQLSIFNFNYVKRF